MYLFSPHLYISCPKIIPENTCSMVLPIFTDHWWLQFEYSMLVRAWKVSCRKVLNPSCRHIEYAIRKSRESLENCFVHLFHHPKENKTNKPNAKLLSILWIQEKPRVLKFSMHKIIYIIDYRYPLYEENLMKWDLLIDTLFFGKTGLLMKILKRWSETANHCSIRSHLCCAWMHFMPVWRSSK